MDVLRNEIIEAQKNRSDLLKWKLILVAGLGTAGLGIGSYAPQGGANFVSSSNFQPVLLLCLIPFVCLYIDTLCRHMNLRMSVIGQFMRFGLDENHDLRRYEDFCYLAEHELKIFDFERSALQWSSYVLSYFVLLYGTYLVGYGKWAGWILVVSGMLGFSLSWIARRVYDKKSEELESFANKYFQLKMYLLIWEKTT